VQPDVVLDRSFRSSPTVLEFVNAVFADLPARAAERCKPCGGNAELLRAAGIVPPEHADEDPVMRVLRSWSFVPHRPADRNGRLPGMIRAIRVGEGQQAAADAVAEIVAQRVAARPGVRIAVLARKNPMVSACAAAIRRRGIAVSDEGRSELLDSPAVLAVLACLRLADQPDDRVAHWLVTREPLRSALGLRPMESFERPVDCTRQADRISADMRQQLAEQGLIAWIDAMTGRLRPTCGARDLERLRQLSALAHGMPADHALDPGRFVRAVEQRLQRAGANERVRVMTIHASKGLEFDEVVLTSTTESLTAMRADANRWVAIAPDPAGAPVAVGPVVSQKLEAHAPLLQAFRRESEVATAFDSISAFYVALTRAKQAIHLACAPMKGKQAAAVTPFFLVSSAFDGFARAFGAAQEGACFWSMGDTELGATSQPAPAPEPGTVPAVEWAPRPGARIVAPPSSHERADGRPTLLDEFEGLPDAARGSLAHGWFEGIEWLPPGGADLSRDHEVREAVALQIRRPVPDDLADRVRQLVVRACGSDSEIGAALRPARYDRWGCERVEVRNEVPYVTYAGGGIQRGRIDRLVLGYRGGRVVRAEVLDHKTGATGVAGDAFEARIAPYRAQMAGYRRVVASMFGIEPSAVSTVLLMLDRGEVIDVTEP
jgi:ATP-dependent exoDNAse (exonuclease V) beta subunit